MTTVAVVINEQDLAAFGFIAESVTGVLDAPSVSYPTTKVPGRAGVVRLAIEPEMAPREIRLVGTLEATEPGTVDLMVGRLKQWLRGDLELRTGYDLTKVYRAVCTSVVATTLDPQHLSWYAPMTLTFTCDDPRAYGAEAQVIGFAGTRTPLPLGTAPSEPIIRIMGPATDPILTYRAANGAVLATHGFTIGLTTTDYLGLSTASATARVSRLGTETNAIATEASGDFLIFDPADGDPSAGAWPTIEVSSGTGEAIYQRVFL